MCKGPVVLGKWEGLKGSHGVKGREIRSLLIKHIFIPLYTEYRLLPFSHFSVTQGSFHSFYLISFNNSLVANQRKGVNYLISTLLLCDCKMLLTFSTMGIPLACHSGPACSLPWACSHLGLSGLPGTRPCLYSQGR